MKRKTKKVLLRILTITLVFVSSVVIVKYIADGNIGINSAIADYKKDNSSQTLYTLCTSLVESRRYGDIIEYFPVLFESSDFPGLVRDDKSLENQSDVNDETIIDCFVFSYLNAVYKKTGELMLRQELEKYRSLITFAENENGNSGLFMTLQVHFTYRYGSAFGLIDREKTKVYLSVMGDCVDDLSCSPELKIKYYDFLAQWYGSISEPETCVLYHKKTADLEKQKKMGA